MLVLVILATSCKFQRVLKSSDMDSKYAEAIKLYNEKDYSRALQLFDQLVGVMRATDKTERIYYYYAYSYFYQQDYTLAAYYFKRYASNFPNTAYAEECMFMSAYCNYKNSSEYSLDQTNTYEAIKELQLFANMYPESSRVPECNDLIDQLRVKLEKKDYKIARLYYRMDDYTAALVCYNNILNDFPETPHREEILFMIFKANYKYASASVDQKKKERFTKALAAYKELVSQYPSTSYLQEANTLRDKSQKEMNDIAKKEKNTVVPKTQ